MHDPFAYQTSGAAFLRARRNAYLADEPGLGKTLQVCLALRRKQALVVCPANALANWHRALRETGCREAVVVRSGKDKLPEACSVVVSYDLARHPKILAQLEAREFDRMVCDEAHYLGNRAAARTQAVLLKLARRAEGRWFVSGTPANNPLHLWPILRTSFPSALSSPAGTMSEDVFMERYCNIRFTDWGPQVVSGKNLGELRQRLAPFMLRRRAADVLPDLPPLRFGFISMDLPTDDLLWQADIEMDDLPVLDENMARMRKQLASYKAVALADFLAEELEANPRPLVIFGWHTEALAILAEKLTRHDRRVCVVDGSIDPQVRQDYVDGFQNGTYQIFVGQIKAAGVNYTLTRASEIVMLESSWNPDDDWQAILRIRRIGQTRPCIARLVSFAGTIDEGVMRVQERKLKMKAELFDVQD